jgi:hypothetical protein
VRVIARSLLGNNGLSPQQFQDLPGEDSELFGLILLVINSLRGRRYVRAVVCAKLGAVS